MPHRVQRVLLVDDHPILCEGLAQKINGEPDLMVCGQSRDAHAALEAIPRTDAASAHQVAEIDLGPPITRRRRRRGLHRHLGLRVRRRGKSEQRCQGRETGDSLHTALQRLPAAPLTGSGMLPS